MAVKFIDRRYRDPWSEDIKSGEINVWKHASGVEVKTIRSTGGDKFVVIFDDGTILHAGERFLLNPMSMATHCREITGCDLYTPDHVVDADTWFEYISALLLASASDADADDHD